MRRPRKEPVYLNVYDLSPLNDMLAPFGLGFFHTGVEVHGVEYCYGGGGGIIHHRPRAPPSGAAPGQQASTPFRVQLLIGEVEATSSEVQRVVDSLRGTWLGSEYHLLTRNCNCFADELSTRLCGKRIPGYVNRLAGLGVYFSCLLPPNMRPPVSSTSTSNSSSGGSSNSSSSGAAAVGRVLGGGGARSSSSDAAMGGGGGGGAGRALSAEEARAKRLAAVERRQAGVGGEDEKESAPLTAR